MARSTEPDKTYHSPAPRARYHGSMSGASGPVLVGVDTGGTFTDFVVLGDGALRTAKLLSTPNDPARAIVAGLKRLGLSDCRLEMIHGTTVGTNAVLESEGARVVFVTNRGFADLLGLARQNRDHLYRLDQPRVPDPVPEAWCLETGGRIGADSQLIEPLSDEDLLVLARDVARLKPEAVAINLLFSFKKPEIEARIREALTDALGQDMPISLSSEVLPEIREYERAIATWLNASIGPRLAGYLGRVADAIGNRRLAVMQSNATTIDATQAGRRAVHLLLSGPAGGLAAAAHIGAATGHDKLLTFDMGGTSTDVALITGRPRLTREGRVGRYPVAVPMVDMHTIGAGGGSIARVDAGGLLRVGPRSAGADPGPACYGRGGEAPTVTDANLVLGRIPSGVKLGGEHALDLGAAARVLTRLGEPLGLDTEQAARGVIRVANEHMSRALRVMSAERGLDPARFVLMSFGGAGGLHVCELAESLGMDRALVPARAGVLSALGMLVAEPGRQLTASFLKTSEETSSGDLEAGFCALEDQAVDELEAEGLDRGQVECIRRVECRYRGQDATLLLDADAPERLAAAFHDAHENRYGHRLELPVELVNLRVSARGPRRLDQVPPLAVKEAGPESEGEIPVWRRECLPEHETIDGPAIILDPDATTWLAERWSARRDGQGHLRLSRRPR